MSMFRYRARLRESRANETDDCRVIVCDKWAEFYLYPGACPPPTTTIIPNVASLS